MCIFGLRAILYFVISIGIWKVFCIENNSDTTTSLTPGICQRRPNLKIAERWTVVWNGTRLSDELCEISFEHIEDEYTNDHRICFNITDFKGKFNIYLKLFYNYTIKDQRGYMSRKKVYSWKIPPNRYTAPLEYCYTSLPAGIILHAPYNQSGIGYLRIYVMIENTGTRNVAAWIYTGVIGGLFVLVILLLIIGKVFFDKACILVQVFGLFIMFPLVILSSPLILIDVIKKKCTREPGESQENHYIAGCLGCCRHRSAWQQQTPPNIAIFALSDLPVNSGSVMSVVLSSDEVRDEVTA